MRRLDRYIFNQILLSIGLVLLIFIGVYIIFSFVGEMHNFNKGYGLFTAILPVLYSIPKNLIFMIPLASLLGTLIALGYLADHSELTAMRAGGFSVLKIALVVLKAGILIALISVMFAAFISPFFQKKSLLSDLKSKRNDSFLLTPEATWLKSGQDFIYIGGSQGSDALQKVVKYHFNAGELVSITWAEEAIYKEGAWHLFHLSEVDLSLERVLEKDTSEAIWPDLVPPTLLKAVSSTMDNLNVIELYRYLNYRHLNGLDTRPYELKIWQIYAQALSIIVLMLIAVPFAFGQFRSSSLGFRLVLGVMLGVGFFLLDRFFGPMVLLMNWPIFLGAFLPSLIFLGLAGIFFWRFTR